MKFRTDFVTNSSSSSFLLAEGYDEEKFQEHIRKKVKEFQEKAEGKNREKDDYVSGEEYEEAAELLPYYVGRIEDMEEIDEAGVEEMLAWYEDDVLGPILKKKDRGEELEEAEVKKIFQWFLLRYAPGSVEKQECFCAKVSKEAVQDVFKNLADLEPCEWEEQLFKICEIACAHYEDLQAYGDRIVEEGYTYIKLVKEFLGCSKAFYDDLETHFLVVGAVAEFEDCRFSCNHMG